MCDMRVTLRYVSTRDLYLLLRTRYYGMVSGLLAGPCQSSGLGCPEQYGRRSSNSYCIRSDNLHGRLRNYRVLCAELQQLRYLQHVHGQLRAELQFVWYVFDLYELLRAKLQHVWRARSGNAARVFDRL